MATLEKARPMKATGSTVTEICRDLDKSEAIYRRWVKHCGDISRSGARHCKELQEENAKIRRQLGEAKQEKHCSRIARRENSHPGTQVRAINYALSMGY